MGTITQISFDINLVYNYVYAQSAWYCAHHTEARVITADQEKILKLKLVDGIADFNQRFDGYIVSSNLEQLKSNESHLVNYSFKFNKEKSSNFCGALEQSLISLLAHYILMKIYADASDTSSRALQEIFTLEWKRTRSKIMMSFSFDAIK